MMRPRLAIVGWSKAGSAVARAFARGADLVAVWNRSPLSDSQCGVGEGIVVESLDALVGKRPDLVMIAVTDAAIPEVAGRLASSLSSRILRGPLVLFHLSGALSSKVLMVQGRADVRCGSVHPIRSFASHSVDDRGLEGCDCGIEGDASVRELLGALVRGGGGRPLIVDEGRKSEYHLAASIASNALLGLMDLAVAKMLAAGVARADAERALIGLARGTLENADRVGIDSALTGPILRGDAETVGAHLRALSDSPTDRSAYVAAAIHQLVLARRRHPERLERYEEIEKILRSEGPST